MSVLSYQKVIAKGFKLAGGTSPFFINENLAKVLQTAMDNEQPIQATILGTLLYIKKDVYATSILTNKSLKQTLRSEAEMDLVQPEYMELYKAYFVLQVGEHELVTSLQKSDVESLQSASIELIVSKKDDFFRYKMQSKTTF